jgi:hypothetical protein
MRFLIAGIVHQGDTVKSIVVLCMVLGAGPTLAATPTPPATTLVLVVASNRGTTLDRPPLQYADDDGAKYHEVFASLAGEANTVLLTEFDADSARLFPHLAASVKSPTRAHVDAAVGELALRAQQARQGGQHVGFYFVFAGHGDVDQGRGFLELADSAFTADDLDALLRRVGADEAHVILDSCNSFFVINPRKPGGRRFATPRDAAEKLARRLPNVGVFLSTSAEAEVFEWSELQSGVFSHAVRSGLMGAADANHDGKVSYEELAAFVATAAGEIKNPLFRPNVFARGPNGDDERTLFDLSQTHAFSLTVDAKTSMRLDVRDRDGLRWLDAHKEADQVLDLHLPAALASHMEVERLATDGNAAERVEASYRLPDNSGKAVLLAELAAETPKTEARGAQEIFRGLFVRPFGANALAAYREEQKKVPEPVFGISREDSERMGLLLEQLQSSERQERLTLGTVNLTLAGVYGIFFGLAAREHALTREEKVGFLVPAIGLTALSLGVGLYRLSYIPERERTYERFRADLARSEADQARVAATVERRLEEIQEQERHERKVRLISGYLCSTIAAGLVVLNEFDTQTQNSRILARSFLLAMSGSLLARTLREQFSTSATEKFIQLWRKDPRQRPMDLSLAPIAGGGMFALSGSF